MFRKLSSKLKPRTPGGEKVQRSPSKVSSGGTQGAAVPYLDSNREPTGSLRSNQDSIGGASSLLTTSSSEYDGHLLGEAAAKGDTETVRQLLKSGYDINSKDEKGNTALLRAAGVGQTKIIRFLLLHGADVEARNERKKNSLFVALEGGHVQTVGILLDYMHSVDKRSREPFVLLRAHRPKGGESYLVEEVRTCTKIMSLKKQGCDSAQLLVAQGQRAEDMAIFLYSILDVPVQHAFIVNTVGQMNMNNFQKFEDHAKSESLTVLNTGVKVIEAARYTKLRTLILVSCGLHKLSMDQLPCLELIDVRYNKLTELPGNLCKCANLKTMKVAYNHLRGLPRNINQLAKTLVWLDCSYNHLKQLPSTVVSCIHLKQLYCDHNYLTDLPMDIGVLSELELLTVDNNKLSKLPLSVAGLTKLNKVSFHSNPLQNIPVDFPERAAEVKEYLQSLQEDPVVNKTVKLVLVGQEGVGKTTLLKALKRTMWAIPRSPSTPKTDGIDVKDIELDEVTLRCFDCGGDVDFNETHNFFITQGALYLACFNLAEYCLSTVERNSFLLGRLQLWLQYIFSKVPNTQVVIVGTHADHDTMSRPVFEEIWERLRAMMMSARTHHRSYFQGELLPDCLLCQSDTRCLRRSTSSGTAGFVNLGFDPVQTSQEESSFMETPGNIITFPHVMGYYEVSSVKAIGNQGAFQFTTNQSIEHLKTAITSIAKKMISCNPEIPRRWADVRDSLLNHSSTTNSVVTLSEIATLSRAHGISGRTELTHMLQFLKAQGTVLYFPQIEELEETVILDPEWLAKVFSTVVSYRDTGINNEGFIERDKLKQAWQWEPDKLLSLLHHFGLCLPIPGTTLELFPCKLPIGEPEESVWPLTPPPGTRQLTYSLTFPSMIPPPLFSDLIVSLFRYRANVTADRARYYANNVVDSIRLDRIGCKDCKIKPENPKDNDPSLIHQVSYELIPHKRTIYMSVRGTLPCCTVRKAGRVLNKVVARYEGLRSVDLDCLVCPGCYLQKEPHPHKFHPKSLHGQKSGDKVLCANGHVLPDVQRLLTGVINDNCYPTATVKSTKSLRKDKTDFSGCPRLFVMLPVNKDGMSFDTDLTLFVSSVMFDGYAAHLLCEFPDGYHMCGAPGYRLKNPKEFIAKFGTHVIAVLHLLGHMTGSTVSSRHANYTKAVTQTIGDLITDLLKRFPSLKDGMANYRPPQLVNVINEKFRKLKREDLRKHFHIVDKADSFGPLRRLQYSDTYLWLCSDHYKQLKVLSIGTIGPHTNRESLA